MSKNNLLVSVQTPHRLLSKEANGYFLPLPYLAVGGLGETNRLDAAIDNLRLSTVQRYSEDFAPSARECEFGLDPQTRALFLFNGSLQGTGAGLGEPLIGLVKE